MSKATAYATRANPGNQGTVFWAWLVVLALMPAWLAMAGQARAADRLCYLSAPGKSLVEILGTSTLHDWSAQGKVIQGSLVFVEDLATKLGAVDKSFPLVKAEHVDLDFRIPVKSLKSDSKGLEEKIYQNLDYQKHPEISFGFLSASFVSHPQGGQYVFKVKGVLRINGVQRPHDLSITVHHTSGEQLLISAETAVKMTDFNITPPTFLGGFLESGDKVKVRLRWGLVRGRNPGGAK